MEHKSIRTLRDWANTCLYGFFTSHNSQVCTDSTPAISIALYSFVTAGTVATALAAAILSISSANLEAIGTVASGSTNVVALHPSLNLHVSIKMFSCAKNPFKQLLIYNLMHSHHVLYNHLGFSLHILQVFITGNGWTPTGVCPFGLVHS